MDGAPATAPWDAGLHDLHSKTSTHTVLPRQHDSEERTDAVVMVTAACEMRCWLKWREVRNRRRNEEKERCDWLLEA